MEPLTCTCQLSKWNVPRHSSTNPLPIHKTLVKKIKFRDNPSTEFEPENNCYDPRAPNDKNIDNYSVNILKRDLKRCLPSGRLFQRCLPSGRLFYLTTLSPNARKIMKKNKLNVKFFNLIMGMKIETVDNFPLPFNEFHDNSQDSFKDMVDKYVVDILLADDDIKHIEYSTRGQQSSNLWGEYRKEKLTTSDVYIAVVNKVEPNKIKSSFKTSSVKHGIVNESVALTEYAVNA